MAVPINLTRPALRYHGSKFRLADWIIPHFPPHKTYCEPFAGGFSAGLQKPPSHYEVYNDLDGEVVNFFRVLRERPAELIRAIQLTPYSRQEWKDATNPSSDPVDRARCLYVRCWMSYGSGTGKTSTGWRFHVGRSDDDRSCVTREFSSTDHLWQVAARLKEIQIECDDGLTILERYDLKKEGNQ
jgi:DNA adenine methylase